MSECRDFFAWNADNKEIVKALQQRKDQALGWEKMSASDHSPGTVTDEELLYRQVLHPIHIDPDTRQLKPTAFDDVANKGLSVERATHMSLEAARAAGERRAADQRAKDPRYAERQLHGVAELSARDIRSIKTSASERAFAVYDTAKCDDPAHADVCQLVSGNKQAERSARSYLRECVRHLHEK